MTFLGKIYLGNAVQTWLIALGVVFVVFLILKVLRRILIRHLSGIAQRTATQINDLFLAVLSNTRNFFYPARTLFIRQEGHSSFTV